MYALRAGSTIGGSSAPTLDVKPDGEAAFFLAPPAERPIHPQTYVARRLGIAD